MAIALVAQAVYRVTGKSYRHVQLLAGAVLATGQVAEMQTGEGKTLTSAIASYALALRYKSVHVAAPNAYLAKRDFEELKGIFELLGLTVGWIPDTPKEAAAAKAYQADITYGAGYAFGFDFLRDDLMRRRQPVLDLGDTVLSRLRGEPMLEARCVQTGLLAGVIDEIDSVLLDEAMTPLILSIGGPTNTADLFLYSQAQQLADRMELGADFTLQESGHVLLGSHGMELCQRQIDGLSEEVRNRLKRPWTNYVTNALQATYVLKPDVDFVIQRGKIVLVDQMTGRLFSDRSWRAGLQQAVEMRASLEVTSEKNSAGRITRQSYYRMYEQLCGMTGTAVGAEHEFKTIYGLNTVEIPLHQPTKRISLPDRYFGSHIAKMEAVAREVQARHHRGQPVLVGTRTIADSEFLAELLTRERVPHLVLNGKQDQAEAEIVAEAGKKGRVTVATNMAGRGTDIKLDKDAIEVGGLHVICTERHSSQRVDRQFAGRSARAGVPGSCQFFIAATDELIVENDSNLSQRMSANTTTDKGECRRTFNAPVSRIQRKCECQAYQKRRMLVHQDAGMTQLVDLHTR